MTRFLALTRFEIRLWLRSTGFWLAVAAMHALSFATLRFNRLLTSHWLGEQILGSGLLFGSLLILFASAAVIARERTEGTEELFDALPTSNAHMLFSRWLSGTLLWLLVGVELFVLAGTLIVLQPGAVLEVRPLVSLYVLHYIPAVLFIHTLGSALAVFIRQTFILYSVVTVIWGATTFVANELALESFWNLDALTLFHLTGIGSRVRRLSDLVGVFPFGGYVFWQRVFFGGLTVLLLAIAALKLRPERERGDARHPRRRTWSLIGSVIGLPLIFIGPIQYMPQYSTMPVYNAASVSQFLAPGVTSAAYDLQVVINDPGWYTVTANIRVYNHTDNASPEINFALSSACQVASGSALEHVEDILTITLPAPLAPGDATEAQISYRCPVHPLVKRFSTPRVVTYVIEELIYPMLLDDQVLKHFSLSVEAPEDFTWVTSVPKVGLEEIGNGRLRTHFAGEATRLDVFGAPLAYDVIHGIETYYYPAHAAAISNYIEELAARIAFYETWLGEAEYVPGVTPRPVVVENLYVSSPQHRASFKEGFLSADEWYVPQFYRPDNQISLYLLASQAASLWWGPHPFSDFSGSVTMVEAAANSYLTVLYTAHRDGEEKYDEAIAITEADLAAHESGDFSGNVNLKAANQLGLYSRGDWVGIAVFLTLHNVRSLLGDDALQTVLVALHQRHIELTRIAVDSSSLSSSTPLHGRPTFTSAPFWIFDSEEVSPTEASLRFLLDTITALPGGSAVAERSLGYLPKAAVERLGRTVE